MNWFSFVEALIIFVVLFVIVVLLLKFKEIPKVLK